MVRYYDEKFGEIDEKIKVEKKPDLKIFIEKIMEKKGSKKWLMGEDLPPASQTGSHQEGRVHFLRAVVQDN